MTRVVRRYVSQPKCAFLTLLSTDRIVSILLHVIGRSARAGPPMVKSRLVRALVPSHSYVQGSCFLAMAHHLAHSLRFRGHNPCMDDLCCSVGCDPRTPPTSCMGRTTSIIVSLHHSPLSCLVRMMTITLLTMFALIGFLVQQRVLLFLHLGTESTIMHHECYVNFFGTLILWVCVPRTNNLLVSTKAS